MIEEYSPWGGIQWSEPLIPGMDLISTASHGGVRVSREAAMYLSPGARKCGFRDGGFLWFEEDCQESVVLRELLDKKLWQVPDRIKDPEAFTADLDQSIKRYNPDYWNYRQRAQERAARKQARPAKEYTR